MATNTSNSLPCPELENYLVGEECGESFAGLGEVIYAFERKALKAALARNGETYTLPANPFKPGKYLYKFECKRESQQIQGEGQGDNAGFRITLNMVLKAVNKRSARILRTIQNRDLCYIIPDGDEYQILYDKNKKVYTESGDITTDTGAAAGDDRQSNVTVKLGPVAFPNMFLDITAIDDLETLVAGDSYIEVTPEAGENPYEKGYYVKRGDDYILTQDTTAEDGETYYTLG